MGSLLSLGADVGAGRDVDALSCPPSDGRGRERIFGALARMRREACDLGAAARLLRSSAKPLPNPRTAWRCGSVRSAERRCTVKMFRERYCQNGPNCFVSRR